MMEKLAIMVGVLAAILFGPLVLRLSFLFLCIAWDLVLDTRSGVELYDSVYGKPEEKR